MKRMIPLVTAMMLILPIEGMKAEGAEVSKFVITTFTLGVAMRFGSVYMYKMANESYDRYLHTVLQAEMKSHLDDYKVRHQVGMILSGSSTGFIALSAIYSLYLALRPPEERPVSLKLEHRGRETRLCLYASLP
ncbi:hypothetical protein J7M22_17370 [Candidatus Poribacteria bacterium]|nr:hypothetical protein [Candidatus Poribacteria bacterium]